MKKVLAALLLLTLSLTAHAAEKSYAGTWVLDPAASRDLPEPLIDGVKDWRLTVDQNATDLTVKSQISRANGNNTESARTYKLDGTPTKFEMAARTPDGPVKVPTTATAKVETDGSLHLTLEGELPRGEQVMKSTIRERFELSEDGKTLTVHRKDKMPNGEFEFAMVFRKA